MAVYDRWHRDGQPGDEPCKCGKGRNRLYPSAVHQRGDRWQVRWRDPATGKQEKKNFAVRDGDNPNINAAAFDKVIQAKIVTKTYADPSAGDILFQEYCETWRAALSRTARAARAMEKRLRHHVYEGEQGSGRTPMGGASIGQHPMRLLAQRPTVLAGWVAAMPLAEGSKRKVWDDVAAVLAAAAEDGVIARNPAESTSVKRPGRGGHEAQPYSAAEVAAIEAGLAERYRVVARLGAGTGMRQMEMSGLGEDDIHPGGRRPRVHVEQLARDVDGALHFAPLKAGRPPRDVPLARPVAELLDAHAKRYPPVAVTLPWYEPGAPLHGQPVTVRLVLTRPDGTPLTRGSFDSAWRTAVARYLAERTPGGRRRRVLARGWNVHRTRHTYASMQLREGVDVVRLAKWMGDTVQEVVRTYLHQLPGDDDEADGRAAVEAFFASGEGACAPGVPQGKANPLNALAGTV